MGVEGGGIEWWGGIERRRIIRKQMFGAQERKDDAARRKNKWRGWEDYLAASRPGKLEGGSCSWLLYLIDNGSWQGTMTQ